jgi:hypothetical protein
LTQALKIKSISAPRGFADYDARACRAIVRSCFVFYHNQASIFSEECCFYSVNQHKMAFQYHFNRGEKRLAVVMMGSMGYNWRGDASGCPFITGPFGY